VNATAELIAALTAGGMNAAEAAGLVARAAVEMTGALTRKSPGAARQQRYRERHKASPSVTPATTPSVTQRNESVTRDATEEASQSVTDRNEASQSDGAENPPLILSSSSSLEEGLSRRKESKKERIPKKRNAMLPENWTPSVHAFQVAEEHGVNVQVVEQIFRDYLKSSGKLYADYDAAFYNFLRNQRRFSGNNNYGTAQAKSGGSLVASIRRELAELEQSEGSDFALPGGLVHRLSN
jgi:hypothetical protein